MAARKAAEKPKDDEDVLLIPELDLRRLTIRVVGTAPYVSHAWSEKARKMMREAQSGNPKQGKDKKEGRKPEEEFEPHTTSSGVIPTSTSPARHFPYVGEPANGSGF